MVGRCVFWGIFLFGGLVFGMRIGVGRNSGARRVGWVETCEVVKMLCTMSTLRRASAQMVSSDVCRIGIEVERGSHVVTIVGVDVLWRPAQRRPRPLETHLNATG